MQSAHQPKALFNSSMTKIFHSEKACFFSKNFNNFAESG
jgi:hypothetical protein